MSWQAQSLADLHASLDTISQVRAKVGGRLQALESLTAVGQDQDLLHQGRLSELRDLDYAKAISDLSQRQLLLQAAQQSFKQVSQLSLFNIL